MVLFVYIADVLLDDFLIAENLPDSDSPMLTPESNSNVTSPRSNSLSPFTPMSPDSRPGSPSSGGLRSGLFFSFLQLTVYKIQCVFE